MTEIPQSRRGRILITGAMFMDLLDLEGHTVAECFYNDQTDLIEVYIDGPKMPLTRLGQVAPVVTPIYRKKDYELTEIRP